MKKIVLAFAAALFAVNVSAAELSFNNLGLNYQQIDFDCDTNCDGFGVSGSLEFNETFMGSVDYQNFESDVDLTYVSLGARHKFSDNAAIYGQIGAANLDVDGLGSETEGFVGVGVRGMLSTQFEGDFLLRKIAASGSDVGAKLTGTYFFTDTVGASLFLEGSDDVFGGGVGVRFNF